MGPDTLLIIPCCADKMSGGREINKYSEVLSESVSLECYDKIVSTRRNILLNLSDNPKFLAGKYLKNKALRQGGDFGGNDISGKYLPAINRYTGTLYSVPGLKLAINKAIESKDGAKILILSALYGPLHPLSEIQDYNLQMSDNPAQAWGISFKPFLEEYITKNTINRIYLYLGTSTAYYKIAKKAVDGLLAKRLIREAIQYHVNNGSSYHTPNKHGKRMVSDLGGIFDKNPSESDTIKENILRL